MKSDRYIVRNMGGTAIMYNDYEEFEMNDFDDDIRQREELIEEIKKIDTSEDWNSIYPQINAIRKRWRRIPNMESAYEEKLVEEFESYLDAFYAKRKEGYRNNQTLKEELIQRAEQLKESTQFNDATNEMNELMEQWKAIGTAGKDTDDALWEKFNAARQTFFDRKHQYWEDLHEKFHNAKEIKENLIEQAAALADSYDWQKTGEAFHSLMDQWKAAGSAGREHEDRLWEEFNEHRQKFYSNRNAFYEKLHEEQDKKYEEKQKLVEQAKEVAEKAEYTKENTNFMKNLSNEWKAIGSCGKKREDEIWKEFRSIMDEYFERLRNWNEQRHAQWRQRMTDARNRKQQLLLDQQRYIKRMQDEIVGLIGERAIEEMEDRIEEKKEFIKQLEEEIADIDKTLAE